MDERPVDSPAEAGSGSVGQLDHHVCMTKIQTARREEMCSRTVKRDDVCSHHRQIHVLEPCPASRPAWSYSYHQCNSTHPPRAQRAEMTVQTSLHSRARARARRGPRPSPRFICNDLHSKRRRSTYLYLGSGPGPYWYPRRAVVPNPSRLSLSLSFSSPLPRFRLCPQPGVWREPSGGLSFS